MRRSVFGDIAAEMGGVTKALAAMGFTHKKNRQSLAARLSQQQKVALVAEALEQPEWGAVRVANSLRTKGMSISPQAVRSAWYEYDLDDVPQRLRAQRRSHAIQRFWKNRESSPEGSSTLVRWAPWLARMQTITLACMGLAGLVAVWVILR